MSRFIRPAITWVVVLAIAYAGYRFIYPLFLPEVKETDIQTATVSRGDLRRSVPADGVVEPSELVEVKSKASGVVESLHVETGEQVASGQIIAELDKEEILTRLRQAEADLAASEAQLSLTRRSLSPQQRASQESAVRSAEVDLDNARKQFEKAEGDHARILEMHEKGYATDAELDASAAALTAAQSSLENAEERLSAAKEQLELDLQGAQPEEIEIAEATILRRKAELDTVKEELANTTIRAPIAGTVLTRPVEIGTAVASGTSGNTGGTVVCTVGDLSTLRVRARIEETDLGRVKVASLCRIAFDSYSGWVWSGTVEKIEPQGETAAQAGGQGSQGTRFPIDIRIDLESAREEAEMSMPGAGGGGGNGMRRRPPRGGGRGGGRRGGDGDGPAPKGEFEAAEKQKPHLFPNMTANVEIVLEDHPDVLILPAQFVQYEEGEPYVEVTENEEDTKVRERRPVKLGFSDGLRFEITEGLEEGEIVVLEREIEEEED